MEKAEYLFEIGEIVSRKAGNASGPPAVIGEVVAIVPADKCITEAILAVEMENDDVVYLGRKTPGKYRKEPTYIVKALRTVAGKYELLTPHTCQLYRQDGSPPHPVEVENSIFDQTSAPEKEGEEGEAGNEEEVFVEFPFPAKGIRICRLGTGGIAIHPR